MIKEKKAMHRKKASILAACGMIVCGSSAFAEKAKTGYNAIRSGVTWLDDRGKGVDAHDGGITEDNGRYYFFGEYLNDANEAFEAFSCYSSADLRNWKFENRVLKVQSGGILGPSRLGQRVKVLKCPSTGEYVMFMHCDNLQYTDQSIGYATSATINGNYSLKGQLQYNGSPIRMWDMGTFQDADGTGYLLTHEGNIYKLAPDYHSVSSIVITGFAGGSESPTVFKSGNTYFWLASNKTSWERNDNFYYTATSLGGPWTKRGLFAPSGTLTWNSQVTFVLPVTGSKGTTYMYLGDRWSYPRQGTAATYVWQPLTVNGTSLSIPSYAEAWQIDMETGLNGVIRSTDLSIDDNAIGAGPDPIKYTGKWTHAAGSGFNGTESKSEIKGSSLSIRFVGTQIKLYGSADNQGGYARVAIVDSANDTLLAATIDSYCKYRDTVTQLKFASPRLPYKTYTFLLTVLGEHSTWHNKAGTSFGSTGNFVYVDRFSISSPSDSDIYEAEIATLYNSVPQSANAGFSGAGYAHFNNEGSYVEMDFNVSGGGERNVKIAYANGAATARPLSISVNDSLVLKSLDFKSTGAWTNWGANDITLKLDDGLNTIRLTSLTSDGGPDVDKLTIGIPGSDNASPLQMPNHGITFDPATHVILAQCPGEVVRIELYRLNGLKVFSKTLFSGSETVRFQLPVKRLQDGRYLLKMSAGGSLRIENFNLMRQ